MLTRSLCSRERREEINEETDLDRRDRGDAVRRCRGSVACTELVAPGPAKSEGPKPKTPVGGTVTVTVTNSRKADLLEVLAAESGSASWTKVRGDAS
jgi:hypothetical protein